MKKALLFLYLATFAMAGNDEDSSLMRMPFERGNPTPPIVSFFYDLDYAGVGSKQPQAVIACIWPDGRAVWSNDRRKGGAPYFIGHIDSKRLSEFIASLDAKGIFARKVWFSVGVDCPHYDANVIDGRRRIALSASAFTASNGKSPERTTEVSDALGFFLQQLDHLLPREGTRLRSFEYELRRLP